MDRVEETAFAKINLDLRICRRRADGYHDLDSLVAFADIGDHLTFETADDLTLSITGPFASMLTGCGDNLVTDAARALAAMAGFVAKARITLDKRLPVASGIGGGSADAAATLRGLIRLWNLPLSHADLLPIARRLGADVPVCLGSTAVRMQDTGDRLSSISLPTSLPMVLINPREAVSTPEAFRALSRFSDERDAAPWGETVLDFCAYLRDSTNDLETPAESIVPAIGGVLTALRSQPGCALARMSGSGATCFGLFDDVASRDYAAAALSRVHPRWWVIGTDIR